MRIVFMGTPEFAVPSLRILAENGFKPVAVITAPDRPGGRGMQLLQSAVKQEALRLGIPVLQPEKLKAPEFIEVLASYKADLQVVVAFRMLPETVWAMPAKGTFNLHASLLPQYRGAAPINWAIIHGDTETGATTFFLRHEIDTGDIIMSEKEPISPEDNVGSLYERLMHKGAGLVLKTVQAIDNGDVKTYPQPMIAEPRPAPKLNRELQNIDWNKKAIEIHNLVRGLSPVPAAITTFQEKILKVYKTSTTGNKAQGQPGSYHSDGKTYLSVSCADEELMIHELQLEGKKRMSTEEFLRGVKL